MAEICYTQLNLLLLAIEARKYEGGEIYINPKDKIINPNAIGECANKLKSEKLIAECLDASYIYFSYVGLHTTYSTNMGVDKFTLSS